MATIFLVSKKKVYFFANLNSKHLKILPRKHRSILNFLLIFQNNLDIFLKKIQKCQKYIFGILHP